jgi:hypothetical protein
MLLKPSFLILTYKLFSIILDDFSIHSDDSLPPAKTLISQVLSFSSHSYIIIYLTLATDSMDHALDLVMP